MALLRGLITMLAAGPLVVLMSGCMLGSSTSCCKFWQEAPSAVADASTVLTYWDQQIRYAPDTLHNGTPIPGLAGRLLLTSDAEQSAQWLDAKGDVVIDLHDMTAVKTGGQPQMLERWHFDVHTLKRLKRKDGVGDGYTLFLPWTSYRPEITQVKLQVSYTGPTGAIYADPTLVSLRNDGPIPVEHRQVAPAKYQRPVTR